MKVRVMGLGISVLPAPTTPIRVIDFDAFCRETELPRYPERKELCVTLDSIDRASSFMVFISHGWLRSWAGAEGWDGRPHPDNANHEKFMLCVQGIRRAWELWAPDMNRCYVWLDFGCIDQDRNPAMQLQQLDEIMRCTDCIFTPVLGVATVPDSVSNYYIEYDLPAWNSYRFGYTSRGWCRVEMFYASIIPYEPDPTRLSKLRLGLRHLASQGRRAHLLFGSREADGRSPIILPSLRSSHYEMLDPTKGFVTVSSDKRKIKELMDVLHPYMGRVEEGKGNIKHSGRSKVHDQDTFRLANGAASGGGWEEDDGQGRGTYRYASGAVYKGGHIGGKKHGYGVFRYANGDVYEGDWEDDTISGSGTYEYASGAVYEGGWRRGQKYGRGTYRYASGAMYEGDWLDDMMHGYGTLHFANGAVYEGVFEHDKMHGVGRYRYADGDLYEGGFKHDKRSGTGTLRFADGNVYQGDWKSDKMHGHGSYQYMSGDVYEGGWDGNSKHGHGTYRFISGAVYEGNWLNGRMHGMGTFQYANGDVYQGEWVADKKHGHGIFRFSQGTVFTGSFVKDKMMEGVLVMAGSGEEHRASFEECDGQKHNGYRVYRVRLRDKSTGAVHREGLFSGGAFI